VFDRRGQVGSLGFDSDHRGYVGMQVVQLLEQSI
jgi:hypothetical protein